MNSSLSDKKRQKVWYQEMRRALIIDCNGFVPCSRDCSSLIDLLTRSQAFAEVTQTSIAAARSGVHSFPDMILPRFSLGDYSPREIEVCANIWPSARVFALLCNRSCTCKKIPVSFFDVDDFLCCPYDEAEFLLRMKRLLKRRDFESLPPASAPEMDVLIGSSEAFLDTVRQVKLLAQSRAPVIISGETGSGKELLARAIHYRSLRNARPFIPVNCGALPDELFENELFGHLKGAYTNASSAEKGLIAEAEGGTLFLDEIDALSPAAQVKLLRFLQSGEYRPLGSPRTAVADVRVIAATNTDLIQRVELKLFREDLHYRLNVLALSVPPLRERDADVLDLANHFVTVYAKEHGRFSPRLTEDALLKLSSYHWPGNVRELESVIQRAIVLRDVEVLTAADLELPNNKDDVPSSDLFRLGKLRAIVQFERNFIARLLAAHGGNISRAAKAAGKDRRSFQRLVSKYSLDRKSFETQTL